jgi:hypothetical protein
MTYLFTSNNIITGEVEVKNDTGNAMPVSFSATNYDSFGRFRISAPLTLFDSSHRYADNGKFATSNTATTSYSFQANTASIDMVVDTTSLAKVYRESYRVFAYQPGKSLQIINTFVMNPSKANLRQRVGYFSADNGIFLEQSDDVYFVKRSKATGSVVDTKIAQSDWNIDPMDGTGPSGLTLNLAYPQIFWIDIEWLGVGTVRMGFVVNGRFVHCHSIHHANLSSSPAGAYMQTAILPVRYEIENTAATASSSTLKQICSTVISEGGYELEGKMRTIGMQPITDDNYTLTTADVFYPVASIRLKSTHLDAIVIPKNIALVGTTSSDYRYKIISGANVTGGTWISDEADSAVEYNLSGTSVTGGKDLRSSYLVSTGSQSLTVDLRDGDFKFQLGRDSFTSTPLTFTLAVAAKSNNDKILASIDWEEIT